MLPQGTVSQLVFVQKGKKYRFVNQRNFLLNIFQSSGLLASIYPLHGDLDPNYRLLGAVIRTEGIDWDPKSLEF